MSRRIRKTVDEWQVLQLTNYGWEVVRREDKREDAIQRRKEYEENQPEFRVRITKRRVLITKTEEDK